MSTSRVRLIVATSIVIMAVVGCSDSPGSGHSLSAGSCAAGTSAERLAAAKVVFTGMMLPGTTVQTGSGQVLVSPARARVIQYLKGSGPPVVTVATGISTRSGGTVSNEDGIEPVAGQRWEIYATSVHMPYQTSICLGSMIIGSNQ
jgi:hypothetical protein